MPTGIVKANSVVAVEKEVTQGTYVAPSAATSYLQVQEGFGITPAIEVKDRTLIQASPGKYSPRLGKRSVSVEASCELRASGTEGGDVDFAALLESALGAKRSIATTSTTKASGGTTTVLAIEDADISKFNVGDVVCVKVAGNHQIRPITAKSTGVGSATVTLGFALAAAAHSTVVSRVQMYYTANSGHPSVSVTEYIANTVRQTALGCKVSELSIDNFAPGEIASFKFALEGLNFDEQDGAAPHTPSYDSGLPPVILSASVVRDGVETPVSAFGLQLSNGLKKLSATSSTTGDTGQLVTEREISGSINPYKDDTTVANFTAWKNGTEFSLFVTAYIPSSTSGEITMGSIVGIWLPQCIYTGYKPTEADGVMVDEMEFRATRGSAGTSEELYLAFI